MYVAGQKRSIIVETKTRALLVKTRFDMDGYGGKLFEGWTDGSTWNGWDCPWFEYTAAQDIVQTILKMGRESNVTITMAWYDESSDRFRIIPDPEAPDDIEEFEGFDVEGLDGRLLHLYAIGSGSWCWEREVEQGETPVSEPVQA